MLIPKTHVTPPLGQNLLQLLGGILDSSLSLTTYVQSISKSRSLK